MDFNAFDLISEKLMEELKQQGFNDPEPMEDEDGRAEIIKTKDVAYSLLYDEKRERFELRSAILDEDGEAGDEWKSLSLWLFDKTDGTRQDAESIANDFVDVVSGPKVVANVQQQKRRKKGEERVIDPMFFFNRLVNVIPELKHDMNDERITYGQIRPVTFTKTKIVPKVEDLAKNRSGSQDFKKMCELFTDMYKDGDMDLRSVLSISLLNEVSDSTFEKIKENVSDDLAKDMTYTVKLKGKKINPEKPKKQKKVVAKLND